MKEGTQPTDLIEIKLNRILWTTTHANKFDNLDEIDTFLERYTLLKIIKKK